LSFSPSLFSSPPSPSIGVMNIYPLLTQRQETERELLYKSVPLIHQT
jgi:hypothetical protein